MKVKSESEDAQLCLTLSDPTSCSLLGFSVNGVFQARVLEWGATAIRSNNSISGYLFKGNENTNLKRYMFPHVHYSIIYNIPGMEIT